MFTKRELEILKEGLNKLMNVHENEFENELVPAEVFVKWHREELELYSKLRMLENDNA